MGHKNKYNKNKTNAVRTAAPKQSSYTKEKGWKPLAIKLLLLTAAAVTVLVICDRKPLFPPSDHGDMTNIRRCQQFVRFTEKNDIDILMVGNSHLYTGILPDMLSTTLGCNSFIMGEGGIDIGANYYELQAALERCHPKLVVIETYSVTTGGDTRGDRRLQHLKSLKCRPASLDKIYATLRLLGPNSWLPAWSSTIRNHNDIFLDKATMEKRRELYKKTMSKRELYLGQYVCFTSGMTDSVIHLYDSLGAPPCEYNVSASDMFYLNKCIALCKERGIEVMLLTTPAHRRVVPDYTEQKAKRMGDLSALGLRWLDLQATYSDNVWNTTHFENTYKFNQHLTLGGATIATNMLAQYIHDSLDITLPDRTADQNWHNMFYGKRGYYLNYDTRPGDTTFSVVARDITFGDIVIKELLKEKDGTLVLKMDRKKTTSTADRSKVTLTINAVVNGKPSIGRLDLYEATDTYSPRHIIFTNRLLPGVEIKEILSAQM